MDKKLTISITCKLLSVCHVSDSITWLLSMVDMCVEDYDNIF